MSGGSWDYLYSKVREAGERLAHDRDPLRRAMAPRVEALAVAMRAIEWNDSGDGADEDTAIRAFLGGEEPMVAVLLADLDRIKADADALIARLAAVPGPERAT